MCSTCYTSNQFHVEDSMLMPVAIQALAIPDVFFAGNPLKPLADKYNVTVGQILLSWAVARGISVIPKTEKEERMRANASVRELLPALMRPHSCHAAHPPQ